MVLNKKNISFYNLDMNTIKNQNPVLGLQEPQKYCVIPGLISTQKSNLSDNITNSTC